MHIPDDDLTPEQRVTQERLEKQAREIASAMDVAINGDVPKAERLYGFALLMFSFGDPPQPATYISNGEREDMIRAIEEWLSRIKGQEPASPPADPLRAPLLAILDAVDYTADACAPTERVGAVLPAVLIENARSALRGAP